MLIPTLELLSFSPFLGPSFLTHNIMLPIQGKGYVSLLEEKAEKSLWNLFIFFLSIKKY